MNEERRRAGEQEESVAIRVTIVAVLAFLLALVIASPASAQDAISLGDGMSVVRSRQACAYDPIRTCTWWTPSGLSFAGLTELSYAVTFARTAHGRIVAALPWQSVAYAPPMRAAILYTDDRGATWREADWPDPLLSASALAFDPRGPTGIAAGPDGSIWSTDDEGAHWRRRRSATGSGFRAAWVRARTCLLEDTTGALWLSRDRGFSLESVTPSAPVTDDGTTLTITSHPTLTIDARGTVHRH